MDIGKVAPTNVFHKVRHPGTGEFVGLTVELRSINSDEVKKIQRTVTDQRLKLSAKGKTFTAEQVEANRFRLLVAVVAGWEWSADANGEPGTWNGEALVFTSANVKIILSADWLADQLDEALGVERDFYKG